MLQPWWWMPALASLLSPAIPRDAVAQETPFVIQRWQVHDDLPHNEVRAVLQTRDGHIWVATPEGLGRYTGVHFGVQFKVFHSGNTPNLPNNLCGALAEDSMGALWVGLDSGHVLRQDSRGFTLLEPPPGWPEAPVVSLAETATGTMLALSRAGVVAEFGGDGPAATLTNAPPGEVLDLVPDSERGVWLLTRQGLQPVRPNGSPAIDQTADLACAARDGGLWVLSGQTLRRWHDGQWRERIGPLAGLSEALTCLLETSSGAVMIGTRDQGLWQVARHSNDWEAHPIEGFPMESVLGICEDHEGSLWVGTERGGLLRLSRRRAMTLTIPHAGTLAQLLSVAPGQTNDLWVGSVADGLFHLEGGTFRPQPLPAALDGIALPSLHPTESGALWIGTKGHGLWQLKDGTAEPLPGWPWPSATVHCIRAAPSNTVWVGMADGLACLGRDGWQRVKDGEAFLSDDVRCLVPDQANNLYFGTIGRGLGRLRLTDQTLVHFSRQHGLGSSTVYALAADPDRTVWIGTQGGGLARLKNGRISRISALEGLRSATVCQILQDSRDRLWLATLGGVVCVNRGELNACADGTRATVSTLVFDLHEGFSQVDFVAGNQPAALRTPDDRLWFVAGKGLGVIDSRTVEESRNRVPPPMVIESLRVDDVDVLIPADATAGPLQLPPGVENIEIGYNALSYLAPRRVRFQYQLEGVDEGWVDAGALRQVRFAHLPPGHYTFRVRGSNSDGVWNQQGRALAFHLAPHFWQTGWFRLVLGLAGALGIGGATYGWARQRHRRKLQLVEQREALELERGRIARDMHDEVGAKLTRITVLSRLLLRRQLLQGRPAELLGSLAQTARECVKRFDQIVWTVNPENDNLQDLSDYLASSAASYLDGTGVELRLNMPEAVPSVPVSARHRDNLLHAFEEALSNALRHSGARRITVSMVLEEPIFVVRVEDDGQWRERSPESHHGNGLNNMRLRMKNLGGQCAIDASAETGTRIELTMPLARS